MKEMYAKHLRGLEIERLECERVRMMARGAISRHELGRFVEPQVLIDRVVHSLIVQLEIAMAKSTSETIERKTVSWPDGWFQALKERHFPAWYLRRYPVRYKSETVDTKVVVNNYCPHLPAQHNCTKFLIEVMK